MFLHLFSVMSNVSFQMAFNHLEWGEDVFTPSEKRYIDQLKSRIHTDAELCRRLALKLQGSHAGQ